MMTPGMTPGSATPVAAARPPALAGMFAGTGAGEAGFALMLDETPMPGAPPDADVVAKALPEPAPDPLIATPDPSQVVLAAQPPPPQPAALPPPETSPDAATGTGLAAHSVPLHRHHAPDRAETVVQERSAQPAKPIPATIPQGVPTFRTTAEDSGKISATAGFPERIMPPGNGTTGPSPALALPKDTIPPGAKALAGVVAANESRPAAPPPEHRTVAQTGPAGIPEPVRIGPLAALPMAVKAPDSRGTSAPAHVAISPGPQQAEARAAGLVDTTTAWPSPLAVDPAQPVSALQDAPDPAVAATGSPLAQSPPPRTEFGITTPQPLVAETTLPVESTGTPRRTSKADHGTPFSPVQTTRNGSMDRYGNALGETPVLLPRTPSAGSSSAAPEGGTGTTPPTVGIAPFLQGSGNALIRPRPDVVAVPALAPAPAVLPLSEAPSAPVVLHPFPAAPAPGDGEALRAKVPPQVTAVSPQRGIPILQANPDQALLLPGSDAERSTAEDPLPPPLSFPPSLAAQAETTPAEAGDSTGSAQRQPLRQGQSAGDGDLTLRATRAYQSAGMGTDLPMPRLPQIRTVADAPLMATLVADPATGRMEMHDARPPGPATKSPQVASPSPAIPAAPPDEPTTLSQPAAATDTRGLSPVDAPPLAAAPAPASMLSSAAAVRNSPSPELPTRPDARPATEPEAANPPHQVAASMTLTPRDPIGPAPATGIPARPAHDRPRPVKDDATPPARPVVAAIHVSIPAELHAPWLAETGTLAAPDSFALPALAAPSGQTFAVPPPILPSVPVTQLAPLAVAIATDPGSGALDVALSPDELGRLHMHISTEGDSLRIAMTVERPDTLDLLRRHSEQLLADLRQAGFGGATLSFGQGSTGEGRMAGSAPAEPPPPPADPVQADKPLLPAYPRGQSTGHAPLDLRL